MLSKNIRQALEAATKSSSMELGTNAGSADPADRFKTIQRTATKFFGAAAAVCVLIFLVVVYLILIHRDDIKFLTAVQTIGGISLSGLVTLMIRLAKSYSEATVIWILASKLPTDDIRPTLNALLTGDKNNQETVT